MRKKIRRFETMMWMFIKLVLYVILMAVFILLLGRENQALLKVSRTMGITFSTYIIVGLLFLTIYGKYDVGRRKSKPIVYSMSLAVIFTDIITYVQLMVMNTIAPTYKAFRLNSLGALFVAMIIQIIIIMILLYYNNCALCQ